MIIFPDATVGNVGGSDSSLKLTGNIKDLKTKTVTQGDGDKKTTSVFIQSVKVFAGMDADQNGKVNYQEFGEKGKSIFDNSKLDYNKINTQAFSNLNENAKVIANNNSANKLTNLKTKFSSMFEKFNAKVGYSSTAFNPNDGVDYAQNYVNTSMSALDVEATKAAKSFAEKTNQDLLQTYQKALESIAKDAQKQEVKEAKEKAIQDALHPQPDSQQEEPISSNSQSTPTSGDSGASGGSNAAGEVKSSSQNDSPTPVGVNNEQKTIIHTIRDCENLTKIAKHYGVSIDDIIKANETGKGKAIVNKNLIIAGKEIKIPKKEQVS